MKQLSKIVTLLAVFSTSQGALSQSFPQPPRVGVTEEAPKTKAQLTKELNEAIKLSQAGVAAYKSKNRDTISIYVRIDANNVSEKFMMLRFEAEEQGFTEIAVTHEWLWKYLDNAEDVREINWYLHSIQAAEDSQEEFLQKIAIMFDKVQHAN